MLYTYPMSVRQPTDKQVEVFVNSILNGDTQLQAFRYAYPRSNANDDSAYVAGSDLMKVSKICLRLESLRLQQRDIIRGNSDAALKDRVEALDAMFNHGREVVDGKLVDGAAALKASDQLNKMAGAYDQDGSTSVSVYITQDPELDSPVYKCRPQPGAGQ